MKIYCPICHREGESIPEEWRCTCGEAWEPYPESSFDLNQLDEKAYGVWRYSKLFGPDFTPPLVRFGAGNTPLVPVKVDGNEAWAKLEYIAPTGSFKDRGTEIMTDLLKKQHVKAIMDDSSGNAGASIAAYAAYAGLLSKIFVPDYASPEKKNQIALYGGELHSIPGLRVAAKEAAIQAIGDGCIYSSHAYHPAFLLGMESIAWEVWEQLNHVVPDVYLAPVGQGINLLGAWLGFKRLYHAGLAQKEPRIVAVQPELLCPVVRAVDQRLAEIPSIAQTQPSLAEGLAISQPVRGKRIVQAIYESGGTALAVSEEAIIAAQTEAAHQGLFIEPTSATALAAMAQRQLFADSGETICIPLTGSGLKGKPRLKEA